MKDPRSPSPDVSAERLAAGVLHEMNNVLGTVLAATHMIESNAGDRTAVLRYTQHITDAVEAGREQLAPLRALARHKLKGDV